MTNCSILSLRLSHVAVKSARRVRGLGVVGFSVCMQMKPEACAEFGSGCQDPAHHIDHHEAKYWMGLVFLLDFKEFPHATSRLDGLFFMVSGLGFRNGLP